MDKKVMIIGLFVVLLCTFTTASDFGESIIDYGYTNLINHSGYDLLIDRISVNNISANNFIGAEGIWEDVDGNAVLTNDNALAKLTNGDSTSFWMNKSTSFNKVEFYNQVLQPVSDSFSAINMDGNYQYVNFGNIANFDSTTAFSTETWFKTVSATSMSLMSRREYYGNKAGWSMRYIGGSDAFAAMITAIDNTNEIQIRYYHDVGEYRDGNWHHAVMTYDGSKNASGLKFYVDGEEQTPSVDYNSLTGSSLVTTNFYLGTESGGIRYNGDLDEPRIWSKVLNQTEINNSYNNGSGTYGYPATDLYAAWHVDEGTGTNVGDYSGNNRDGTFSNMGESEWVTGHVQPGEGTIIDALLLTSEDGINPGEKGRLTIGSNGTLMFNADDSTFDTPLLTLNGNLTANNINVIDGGMYLYNGLQILNMKEVVSIPTTRVGINAGNDGLREQTAVGYQSGMSSAGDYQTAIGANALRSAGSAFQTAVGYYSGYSSASSGLAVLGAYAGQQADGIYLSALGYHAGEYSDGDRNTHLGYKAGSYTDTDDSVYIGYEAGVGSTLSNQFMVQQKNINETPLIQGDFSTGELFVFGNTTAPIFKGNLSWNYLYDYPGNCSDGEAVSGVGDSLVCIPVADAYYEFLNNSFNGSGNFTTTGNLSSDNLFGNLNWSWLESVPDFENIYTKLSDLVSLVGNWTEDKPYYYNSSAIDNFNLTHWTDDLGDRGYTNLSNFSDDLGDRGYTHLNNFTDDLGSRGYTSLSNFTNDMSFYNSTSLQNLSQLSDDLNDRGYSHLSNFTNDIGAGGSGLWTNISGTATYDGNVEAVKNMTAEYIIANASFLYDFPFDIINNLVTNDNYSALSAAQGVILKTLVDSKMDEDYHVLRGVFGLLEEVFGKNIKNILMSSADEYELTMDNFTDIPSGTELTQTSAGVYGILENWTQTGGATVYIRNTINNIYGPLTLHDGNYVDLTGFGGGANSYHIFRRNLTEFDYDNLILKFIGAQEGGYDPAILVYANEILIWNETIFYGQDWNPVEILLPKGSVNVTLELNWEPYTDGSFYLDDLSIHGTNDIVEGGVVFGDGADIDVSSNLTYNDSSKELYLDGDLEVTGNIRGYDSSKLKRVSDDEWVAAVADTEYYSPNQHGGYFGTVYRQYHGQKSNAWTQYTPGITKVIECSGRFGGSYTYTAHAGDGTSYIYCQKETNLIRFIMSTWGINEGWVDYVK